MESENINQASPLQPDVEKDKNADQHNEIYALKLKLDVEKTILDEFFRLIVENSKDGINVLSLETGKYIYMNESQVELTGFSFEEIINITAEEAYDRLHPDDRIISVEQQRQIVAGNDIIDPVEYRWKVKSGEYRWFNDRRTLIKDKQGIAVALVGVSRDITVRKTQEIQIRKFSRELEKLNSDKDKFIAILAHDLKDPFNALLGFTGLLLKNLEHYSKRQIEEQLQSVHQKAQQTYELLEQILLWAKSQSGSLALQKSPFRLTEKIYELIRQFDEAAREKNIKLRYPEPAKLVVNADPYVFNTVMRNLISNAIKFTNNHGEIQISVAQDEPNAIITVLDNGLGIDAQHISQLWDTSIPISTPGTHHEKGTGMGLQLCKDLVEMHGGKIWVKSGAGTGSAFAFSLPMY